MYNIVILFVISLCGSHFFIGTGTSSSLNVERTNRIIGGSPATDDQFPFMISLQDLMQVHNYTRGHRCGGALVTLRHAVTSASCLYDVNVNGVYTLIGTSGRRVFAGAAVLNDDYSRDRLRTIASFTVHPNYSPGTPYVNDIAIITLNIEFPSNVVSTVPLSNIDATTSQGTICTSSGWGSQNDTNSPSLQLMHLQKTVLDQALCQPYYTGAGAIDGTALILQDTMICALATTFSSSCLGDSGNPLVCNGNLNGVLVVKGHDCSNAAYLRPEVYTRVSRFATWINSTIEQTTPTTTTTTTTTTISPVTATTPAPGAASTFQPVMAMLAVIAIVQILVANV